MKRKIRAKRKIGSAFKLLLLMIGAAILYFGYQWFDEQCFPKVLRNPNIAGSPYFLQEAEDGKSILYYPKFENETLQEQVRQQAESLVRYADKKNEKIDYEQVQCGNATLYLYHDEEKLVETILVDSAQQQVIDKAIFDEKALRRISQSIRYQAKASGNELAYGIDFALATQPLSECFRLYTFEDGQLRFTVEVQGQQFTYLVPIEEIASHITLDLGIAQTKEDLKLEIPQRYIDSNRPMVALTFDDGPHKTHTQEILNILTKYDSVATFFEVGYLIERHPDLILAEINQGSEVASHTYNHPYLTKIKDSRLEYELNAVNDSVLRITDGQIGIRYVRPPYGSVNRRVKEASSYPLAMWSIDTLDWKTKNPEATLEAVQTCRDGDIILLHSIHTATVESLELVIPWLLEQGYQLVTLSEMAQAKGVQLSGGTTFSKIR